MNKADTKEAAPIVQRLCNNLAAIIVDKATLGTAARTQLGLTYVNAASLCASDTIGPSLASCFALVRQAGCSIAQMEGVRVLTTVEAPKTLGGTRVVDYSIQMALAQEAMIVSAMTFTSRSDVDTLLASIQQPFADAIETAADTMNPAVFQGLIQLQAALVNHLVQTARPLPEMLSYEFAQVLPSIVISYRLYGDASRYDEIRAENKIVHPAFCPTTGVALSA